MNIIRNTKTKLLWVDRILVSIVNFHYLKRKAFEQCVLPTMTYGSKNAEMIEKRIDQIGNKINKYNSQTIDKGSLQITWLKQTGYIEIKKSKLSSL